MWADAIGIKKGNPMCEYGQLSRENVTGVQNERPREKFWNCIEKVCRYKNNEEDPEPERSDQNCVTKPVVRIVRKRYVSLCRRRQNMRKQ